MSTPEPEPTPATEQFQLPRWAPWLSATVGIVGLIVMIVLVRG